jgi:hypothetical protein
MKKTLSLLFFMACILQVDSFLLAQGCVAIRGAGGSCGMLTQAVQPGSGWQISGSYRNFKSFRHFRGREEEENRVAEGSDVRNYTNFLDLGITKFLNDRWSVSFNLPFQSTARSSLYEHDGKTRHFTSATGVGDLRISSSFWLLHPGSKGNIQLGLGIKFPTGQYDYMDYFYKNDSTRLLGPVDQSIQPGDGGTGLSGEINAFFNLNKHIGLYGNGFYLINPRNHNGVSTTRGGTASATALKYKTAVMSVADQYLARIGANVNINRFSLGAGARLEGIPSKDLVGQSDGFRRPGYIIALEPTISYQIGSLNIFAAVPIAMERNRVQSQSDIQRSKDTGTKIIGDAAFADYSINLGFTYLLNSHAKMQVLEMHE